MRKQNLFFIFIVLCMLFIGCEKDEGDKEKMVEMTIYPETGYGAGILNNIWTQPLIFSDSDENQKRMLTGIITEGIDFHYERGYEYKFKAKKVWMQNPPQDVSSIKYVFIKLLSKNKVITHDSEEEIELFVSSETVKFTPAYPAEYENDGSLKIYDALSVKTKNSTDWMALTNIVGFDYKAGHEYELRVKKVIKAEPYAVKYILLDILSKRKKW